MPKMPAPVEGDHRAAPATTMDGRGEGRIVAESFEEGANISEAARRNGVARGLLDLKVVLAAQPVDFHKSVHTLSALASEALRANPYCGDVFVFRSKRMDRVKLLAWDGSGMVLVTKWLHQGRFTLPRQRLRSIPQTTTADQKPRSGKLEYCQKPNQRSLFFTDD
jgi:transposase